MDPFTQRMLERAKARRDKLDLKISPTKQQQSQRKALVESNQPTQSSILSPTKVERTLTFGEDKVLNEDDVSVMINIVHQNNVQVQVRVEEVEVSLDEFLRKEDKENSLERKKSDDTLTDKGLKVISNVLSNNDKPTADLREGAKTRLQKLGKLYSENGRLSSPIHQSKDLNLDEVINPVVTSKPQEEIVECSNEQPRVKKFGRLAALADQINNWEDDLTHHNFKSTASNVSAKPNSPKKATFTPSSPKTASPIKSFNNRFNNSPKKQSIVPKNDTKSSPMQHTNSVSQLSSKIDKFNKAESAETKVAAASPTKKIETTKQFVLNKAVSTSPMKNIDTTKQLAFSKKAESAENKVVSSPSKKIEETKQLVFNSSPKPFQPQVVGSSPKKQPSNWDKSILDDLVSLFTKITTAAIRI